MMKYVSVNTVLRKVCRSTYTVHAIHTVGDIRKWYILVHDSMNKYVCVNTNEYKVVNLSFQALLMLFGQVLKFCLMHSMYYVSMTWNERV